MDENLLGKLSFLSRFSKIDKDLENDFELILNFVDKIKEADRIINFNSNLNISNQNSNFNLINVMSLREDKISENKDTKSILKNFSAVEDQFAVVSLIIEKEKNDMENQNE